MVTKFETNDNWIRTTAKFADRGILRPCSWLKYQDKQKRVRNKTNLKGKFMKLIVFKNEKEWAEELSAIQWLFGIQVWCSSQWQLGKVDGPIATEFMKCSILQVHSSSRTMYHVPRLAETWLKRKKKSKIKLERLKKKLIKLKTLKSKKGWTWLKGLELSNNPWGLELNIHQYISLCCF